MQTYLTVMFWILVARLFARTIFLVGEHPRSQSINIGQEVFGWISTAFFLAWVSYLNFWS